MAPLKSYTGREPEDVFDDLRQRRDLGQRLQRLGTDGRHGVAAAREDDAEKKLGLSAML
jgi:hypothetical protein